MKVLQSRRMKKKICLLALIASICVLSGCNSNVDEKSEENNNISESSSQDGSSSSSSNNLGGNTYNEENPNAKATTISAMISANNKTSNTTTLYRVTGTAQWPKNTSYGNFDLTDSTGYIYVYGCSKNSSTITKSGSTYSYSNDKSFSSMKINPGDKITMEGLYVWYKVSNSYGYAEFQGYVTSVKRNGLSVIEGKNYTTPEPTNNAGSYYNSISDSDSGASLLTNLHNLMDTTHTTFTSYGGLDSHYSKSDKYGSSGVKCFYSGQKANSYNKEHVWPQSLSNNLYGTDYAGADLHHIRPTISTYNSIRSNASFGPIYGPTTGIKSFKYQNGGTTYCTGNVFEPADDIKGDVARIIMYVYMHYSTRAGGNTKSYYGDLIIYYVMGTNEKDSWKLLRKWNAEDPVSEDEITRNNYAYSVQNNRNPFIDHPTYADRIWG